MPKCRKCGDDFPNRVMVGGVVRNTHTRMFCLTCSPFGLHNTSSTPAERPRNKLIDLCGDNRFRELVLRHTTRIGILRELGLPLNHGYYTRWVNQRVVDLGLDTGHWLGQGHGLGKPHPGITPLDEVLTKGFVYDSSHLKKRLIRADLMLDVCSECGQGPSWNGKPLTLHLDHKNGDHNDNRIDNLRILCPHCHQQTPTFGAKKQTQERDQKECACGAPIRDRSSKCRSCVGLARKTKIQWPDTEWLVTQVNISSVEAVGRALGVSGGAVKKRLRNQGAWVPRRNIG